MAHANDEVCGDLVATPTWFGFFSLSVVIVDVITHQHVHRNYVCEEMTMGGWHHIYIIDDYHLIRTLFSTFRSLYASKMKNLR